MADVFISYARKDIAFVRLINDAIKNSGQLETWVDFEKLPDDQSWWRDHFQAINDAEVFLLIVSRYSLASKDCLRETEAAFKSHKRVIPIVVDDSTESEIADVLPDISRINWIIFKRGDAFQLENHSNLSNDLEDDYFEARTCEPEFSKMLEKLNQSIQMDWGWVKAHTRLQNKALEWQKNGCEHGFLLSGKDLAESEKLFSLAGSTKDPQPTSLQRNFLLESRKNESKKQRRLLTAIVVSLVIVLALAVIAVFQQQQAIQMRDEAKRQEKRSTANQLAAQAMYFSSREPDLAMLLGVEAENLFNGAKWPTGSLEEVINAQPCLKTYIRTTKYGILSMGLSPDGNILVTGSCSENENAKCVVGQIRLWDTTDPLSPKPLSSSIPVHNDWVQNLVFRPDGKFLASGSSDGIIFWEINEKNELIQKGNIIPGHDYRGDAFDFNPDGTLLAVPNPDGTITIWDVTKPDDSISLISTISGLDADVKSLAFSPDGRILAAGNGYSKIMMWDLSNPSKPVVIGKPFLHNLIITYIAFSPDGKYLATASYDRSIILWDIADPSSPKPIGDQLAVSYDAINFLGFTPDSRQLIAASMDGLVRFWDLTYLPAFPTKIRLETPNRAIIQSALLNHKRNVLYFGQVGKISVWQIVPMGEACSEPSPKTQSQVENACKVANRNFEWDEWNEYLTGRPYEITCQNLGDTAHSFFELMVSAQEAKKKNVDDDIHYILSKALELANKTSDLRMKATLCVYGIKMENGGFVLPACNDAVEMASSQNDDLIYIYRDYRGIARFLSGDRKGAVEDFEFFVNNAQPENDKYKKAIIQRKDWITTIEADGNPFDGETLKSFDTYQ